MNSQETRNRFSKALCCPLDAEELRLGPACSRKVYELWYGIVASNIAERRLAGALLDPEPFQPPMRKPTHESIEELFEDDAVLDATAKHVARSRSDMIHEWEDADASEKNSYLGLQLKRHESSRSGIWLNEAFEAEAGWLRTFDAVPKTVRSKHWPSSSELSKAAFLAESVAKMDEGLLAPVVTAAQLRSAALDGLMYLVDRELLELNVDNFESERIYKVRQAWRNVMGRGAFRFAVRYEVPIGAYGGEDARWMIFDTDPAASQVHCYPARGPIEAEEFNIWCESIGSLAALCGSSTYGSSAE